MTVAEIEALADALERRLADRIAGRVIDALTDCVKQVENTVGHEADRIARIMLAELKEGLRDDAGKTEDKGQAGSL